MARSVFQSFASGIRGMLGLQLFLGVAAAGVAGYTMIVTTEVMRERDVLHTRVAALEAEIERITGAPAAEDLKPPVIIHPEDLNREEPETPAPATQPETQPEQQPESPTRTPDGANRTPETPAPTLTDPPVRPETARPREEASPGIDEAVRNMFTAAPPLRTLVLHIRSQADHESAALIARAMASNDLQVTIDVMPPRDPRNSGFAYFDTRQARPATALAQRLQQAAQQNQIASWSVRLRGVALPASGEYTADRVDIVLPPIQQSATPAPAPARAPELQRAPVTNR